MNMMAHDDRVPNERGGGGGALSGQERVEWSRGHCATMRKQRNWRDSSSLKLG